MRYRFLQVPSRRGMRLQWGTIVSRWRHPSTVQTCGRGGTEVRLRMNGTWMPYQWSYGRRREQTNLGWWNVLTSINAPTLLGWMPSYLIKNFTNVQTPIWVLSQLTDANTDPRLISMDANTDLGSLLHPLPPELKKKVRGLPTALQIRVQLTVQHTPIQI